MKKKAAVYMTLEKTKTGGTSIFWDEIGDKKALKEYKRIIVEEAIRKGINK